MCGIYGSTKKYCSRIIERKLQQFKFRGPNHTGIRNYQYAMGELVLGHNRLSIIDLSERANQPMEYANGNIVVVLNGEVYNYLELKQQYFTNQVFATTSDTEVLCALYERFGKDCVQYINGDFAFVIFDKSKQLLFGAVDRLGDKPFYYHHGAEGFEFCSQLMPLCIGNHYTIDNFARQCYFTMQYVPSPYSMVKEVRKLNPGESFTYDLTSKELRIEEYWDLYSNTCGYKTPGNYQEALIQTKLLVEDAVKMRLHADVPVGLFLSGGVDSSVVSMMAAKHKADIHAYSVGFRETNFDESEYARKVAEKLGIPFHRILCSSEEAIKLIPELQYYYDEPMGDASMIPTSLLCQETGEHVRVALGGDGGDEMFFGYPRYLRYAKRAPLYAIPLWLRKTVAGMCDVMGKSREAISLRMEDVQSLYMNRRPSNRAELFDATKVQQALAQKKYLYASRDIRRCFNDYDIKTLMCHAYNVKVDRASMRAGIEVRVPMLDYRIAEYTRLLPLEYCYQPMIGQKRLLKDILFEEFEPELFTRKKQGFGVPVGRWLRNELKDYLIETLNEETVKNLPDFDERRLIEVRDRHIRGEEDQTTLLWLSVHYEEWYRQFMAISKI